jgi:hypothetical protein
MLSFRVTHMYIHQGRKTLPVYDSIKLIFSPLNASFISTWSLIECQDNRAQSNTRLTSPLVTRDLLKAATFVPHSPLMSKFFGN